MNTHFRIFCWGKFTSEGNVIIALNAGLPDSDIDKKMSVLSCFRRRTESLNQLNLQ